MDGFYNVNAENKFNTTVEKLLDAGYEWVGPNKNLTFAQCKKRIHRNGKLIINAFRNNITGKKEMQFGTRSIYNTYPQYKGKIEVKENFEV